MTVDEFISGFLGASTIEMVASISGFICVFLLIRRSIWNFAFGLVQVSLFTWVFFQHKLYSDAILHVFYIGLQFYGYWNWTHHRNQDQEVIIHHTSLQDLGLWFGVSMLGMLGLGFVMSTYTDAAFPYPDAFTTSASLVAQWLMTRRHLFNWVFWIVVDIVAIGIYLQKGLFPTSVLYLCFLIMSCIGQYTWWRDYRSQKAC